MVNELILKCSVLNITCRMSLLSRVIMNGLKWLWFLLTSQKMTNKWLVDSYVAEYEYSSPYPSVFWLVGSFPSGMVTGHSFHCSITVSCCVSGDLLQVLWLRSSQGLLSGYCSFEDVYYKLLCLIVCPIHEWWLFFKIIKSNLSSFALWKTSSFVILFVHFISNILLQLHVTNAFMTLSPWMSIIRY